MAYQRESYERKATVTGGLWDAYKFYKKNNPGITITRKQYVEACKLFNKKISDSIIRESTEFRIFFGIGFIRIRTFKQNVKFTKDGKLDTRKNKIDWFKTKQLWAKIYPGKTPTELKGIPNKKLVIHLNEHTNGYVMRWFWDRRTCAFENRASYVFKPVKGGITPEGYYYGRLGLVQWIKNEDRHNDYYL